MTQYELAEEIKDLLLIMKCANNIETDQKLKNERYEIVEMHLEKLYEYFKLKEYAPGSFVNYGDKMIPNDVLKAFKINRSGEQK